MNCKWEVSCSNLGQDTDYPHFLHENAEVKVAIFYIFPIIILPFDETIYLSTCLSVYLSVCLSIYLSL
jgi:hypothetical protein